MLCVVASTGSLNSDAAVLSRRERRKWRQKISGINREKALLFITTLFSRALLFSDLLSESRDSMLSY